MRYKLNDRRGFTLIELLVVMAILAILTAMAIPAYGKYKEKAAQETDASEENAAIVLAQAMYSTGKVKVKVGTEYKYQKIVYSSGSVSFYYLPDPDDPKTFTLLSTSDITIANMDGYGQCKTHMNCAIKITLNENGKIVSEWVGAKGGTTPSAPADKSHL